LQLLQDQAQWFLEQPGHQFCFEGCAEHCTGTQHAEDVCGEHRPITWRCNRSGQRFILDSHHR
jgi:hypothetical protein